MLHASFDGNRKNRPWLLQPTEKAFLSFIIPRLPRWIGTQHLTLVTLPCCLLAILFCWLAATEPLWLLAVSAVTFVQYVTDVMDGAVGRYRDTGLVKWGFYMDHLLDYAFLCSVLIGYSFLVPHGYGSVLFLVLAAFGAIMVHSFLFFAVTGELEVSHGGISPSEVRMLFVLFNPLVIVFGTGILPTVLTVAGFGILCMFILIAVRSHRRIWTMDMEAKSKASARRE